MGGWLTSGHSLAAGLVSGVSTSEGRLPPSFPPHSWLQPSCRGVSSSFRMACLWGGYAAAQRARDATVAASAAPTAARVASTAFVQGGILESPSEVTCNVQEALSLHWKPERRVHCKCAQPYHQEGSPVQARLLYGSLLYARHPSKELQTCRMRRVSKVST